MANLIDATYFTQQLVIPNATNIAANLQRFIDEKEPEYLEWLLGYQLYNLADTNNWVDQRYKDIKDGKAFTDRFGQMTKWKGLVFTKGTAKKSPIANYVYYWWLRDNWSVTTGAGEKKQQAENAVNSDFGEKMFRAWNEMVEWGLNLREFLRLNLGVYPEYTDPFRFLNPYRQNELLKQRRNVLEKISIL